MLCAVAPVIWTYLLFGLSYCTCYTRFWTLWLYTFRCLICCNYQLCSVCHLQDSVLWDSGAGKSNTLYGSTGQPFPLSYKNVFLYLNTSPSFLEEWGFAYINPDSPFPWSRSYVRALSSPFLNQRLLWQHCSSSERGAVWEYCSSLKACTLSMDTVSLHFTKQGLSSSNFPSLKPVLSLWNICSSLPIMSSRLTVNALYHGFSQWEHCTSLYPWSRSTAFQITAASPSLTWAQSLTPLLFR